jgi:tRNA(fMet)-specific endonuclease VapC
MGRNRRSFVCGETETKKNGFNRGRYLNRSGEVIPMAFIDSDLLISSLRKANTSIKKKARTFLTELRERGVIKITAFNYGELWEGTFWAPDVAKSQRLLEEYLKEFEIVPFSLENAKDFARISSELQKSGNVIGDLDILIAAIVIGEKDVLYTRNINHFDRIPGLNLKNWE